MQLSFLVYDVIIRVYALGIRIAAIFSSKARLWINGRKGWQDGLNKSIPQGGTDLWLHCASLGEFEQGRPVLEAYKQKYPGHFILLTFFSPSGYQIRKNYPSADYVCYLPLDTDSNAKEFVAIASPKVTIFVKYEFWLHYLTVLHKRAVPVLLISAIFRKEQIFFRWYGHTFRQLLKGYHRICVQDEASLSLLNYAGIFNAVISGDTRFDRVTAIAGQAREISGIAGFLQGKEAWVAGSTWLADETIISGVIDRVAKWIIAPHEINEAHLRQIEKRFAGAAVRYSVLKANPGKHDAKQVLIIDNIGMLSSLYQYGIAAYIGGGFGKGIHNILEAAIWGIPVVFGPAFYKFKEARELIEKGGTFSVADGKALSNLITVLQDPGMRSKAGKIAHDYVVAGTGATEKIMDIIIRLQQSAS